MASCPMEVKFAQNLAANEKKRRDKSLKKLKKYLKLKSSKKDGFKEEDFLKLWKGLHYCMWMQDKPLIQEELSGTLSKLVHDLQKHEMRFLFASTFFITEAREWNSIDTWRIDKFMMLMRNILHEMFVLGEKECWSEQSIGSIQDVIGRTVLDHSKDSIPDGVRMHMADIYLPELIKVASDQLEGKRLLRLLDPFCSFILKAQNTVIVKRVISRVFEPIIDHAAKALKKKIDGDGKEEIDDDDEEVDSDDEGSEDIVGSTQKKKIQFDNNLLADHLFQLSVGDQCLSRNRPLVYDIVKRLRDIEGGVVPKEEKIIVRPGISRQDVSEAVQSLSKLQDSGQKKKKRKKKKKDIGGKENLDANNNADDSDKSDNDTDSTSEVNDNDTLADKNRKRRHSSDAVTNTPEPHNKIKKKISSKQDALGSHADKVFNTKADLNIAEKSSSGVVTTTESKSDGTKKESPRKRKHSDNQQTKSKNTTESESNGENVGVVTNKKTMSAKKRRKSGEPGKEFKTVIEVKKDKKKSGWTETPIEHEDNLNSKMADETVDSESVGKTLSAVGNSPKTSSNQSETGLIQNIPESDTERITTPKENKNGLPSQLKECESNVTPSKSGKQNAKEKQSKAQVSDELQEGEIEIWVPNKKYQEKESGGTSFAKFEKTKTPAAFVKKAFSKIKSPSPSNSKRESRNSNITKAPASGKKVQFDMKKNKALAFKDSLQISPVFPFHPDKKPDQGILKSTPEVTPGRRSSPGLRKHSLTLEKRSLPVTQRRRSVATPVMTMTSKQKRRSLPRAKAADFFL